MYTMFKKTTDFVEKQNTPYKSNCTISAVQDYTNSIFIHTFIRSYTIYIVVFEYIARRIRDVL